MLNPFVTLPLFQHSWLPVTLEESFSFNNTFDIIGRVRCPLHEKTHDR